MNFVPAIPSLSQQNQGTGFGNWQQYAGYRRSNPFGGFGGVEPRFKSTSVGVPAPVVDYSTQPNQPVTSSGIDYSIAPSSNATMGAPTDNSMGTGLKMNQDISSDIMSAFGVQL